MRENANVEYEFEVLGQHLSSSSLKDLNDFKGMIYVYHASLAVLVRFSPHGPRGVLLTVVHHVGSRNLVTSWHSMAGNSAVTLWNINTSVGDKDREIASSEHGTKEHGKLMISKTADLLDESLAKSKEPVTVLYAVPDSTLLIGGNMDGDIYFWDVRRCRLLAISEKLHSSPARAIEYLSRSQDLIVGYEDGCKF